MSIDVASAVLSVPVYRLLQINRRCISALYVIFSNAMRSTEYLSARVGDIVGEDQLFVNGAKGSGAYIIRTPGIGRQFREARSVEPARFVSGATYRQLYSACVRIGLGDRVASRDNAARTHAARYRLAEALTKHSLQNVADCLRHRSQRSTIHYLPRGG
jgi:integrase